MAARMLATTRSHGAELRYKARRRARRNLPDDPSKWLDWIDAATSPDERVIRKHRVFTAAYSGGTRQVSLIGIELSGWTESFRQASQSFAKLRDAIESTEFLTIGNEWIEIGRTDPAIEFERQGWPA